MMDQKRRVQLLSIVFFVCAWPQASETQAQAVVDRAALKNTALSIAPQDVAFFSTNLNLRKAWESFLTGSFVTRLRSLPYIQQLEGEVLKQWETPQGQMQMVKDGLKNPNIKNLLTLITDMNSKEIFYYGQHDWNDSIDGIMGLYDDLNARSDNPEAMKEFIAELDAEYLDELSVPTTVIGFRLSDDDIARTLLDALQGMLQLGLQQVPELAPLAKKITRNDLKDGQVLSVTLTTSLIPMDKLEPEVREMLSNLVEGLKDRELVISLGLRENTLLMAVSEDASPILDDR